GGEGLRVRHQRRGARARAREADPAGARAVLQGGRGHARGRAGGLRCRLRGLLVVARKKSDLAKFVQNLAAKLVPGAVVAILDNRYAEGSSTAISRRDAEGNTYQIRHLPNGEEYEVLKNFPAPEELAEAVRPVARVAGLETVAFYWLMTFTT